MKIKIVLIVIFCFTGNLHGFNIEIGTNISNSFERTQELSEKYSEALPLHSRGSSYVESLLNKDSNLLYFVEENYKKSQYLNILVLTDGPVSLEGTLLNISYADIQFALCSLNGSQSSSCYNGAFNSDSILIRNNKGKLELTTDGYRILSSALQKPRLSPFYFGNNIRPLIPSNFSIEPSAAYLFFKPATIQIMKDSFLSHKIAEVKVLPDHFFITRTDGFLKGSGQNKNVMFHSVRQYGLFPIKNKLNLRGQNQ